MIFFLTEYLLNQNLKSQTDFFKNTVNTTKFGLNSLRYVALKVWIPTEIKNSSTVEMFKNKIDKLEPNDCDCKLCQDYFYRLGKANLVDDLSICCLSFDSGHRGSQGPFHI